MAENIEISNAEWEIMRVIWTLGEATSRQLVEFMEVKRQWKPATTKTLLGRLTTKGALATKKAGRGFIYYPLVEEQKTIDQQLMRSFGNICQMHTGKTLTYLVDNLDLTQTDIQNIMAVLQQKLPDAPTTLACDCIPASFGLKHCKSCQEG